MCYRFVYEEPAAELLAPRLRVPALPKTGSRYNLAPSSAVVIVRPTAAGAGREAVLARWGLVPAWAEHPDATPAPANARAEGLADRPLFREACRRRRCLVLASGFYEWRRSEHRKLPYLFRLRDGGAFAFAGLWELWRDRTGRDAVESCTIITTTPNELMRPIHDRMPVILSPADGDRWLDPAAGDPRELAGLLRPYPAEAMTATALTTYVNNVRHDDPACLEPAAGDDALDQLSLGL